LRSVGDIIALTGQGQFVVARLLASLVADGVLAVTDRTGEQPLSQQRAAHLARLEQQLLGGGAAGVTAAANGRASASGDRGLNGHHRPSETGDPGPTGRSPAVRDQAAPEPSHDRRASDRPDASRAHDGRAHDGRADDSRADDSDRPDDSSPDDSPPDDSLEGAGRADGPMAEDTADTTPHDAPLDVAALANPGRRDPAATSAEQAKTDRADAAEQRRAREMAAMGIGPTPDSDAETATAEPARHKAESTSQGTDLLSRLIDGVKGA
ncbi:MAG TPA: hypothetical protein VMM13_06915, partial [Euzebya sp.]|nr:hypothetical protein [Euzebya sp.]